jgi:ABC-type multidrug transport system fused ATPase/permease subunit
MVPQTPTIFRGTIRSNLDPHGQFSDEELWTALDLCDLKEFCSQLADSLDYEIEFGGGNMSVGQKQLLCIAGALLNSPRIVILDESTSAIDADSDQLVQRVVREQMADKTILTIAHRLDSIMDYDRVMVLEKGEIIEFDTPAKLLKNPSSALYALCNANSTTII